VAAAVATLGDLLLLWVANAARPDLGLASPGASALWLGAALGVVAIPLYAVGYRDAARLVASGSPGTARVVSGAGGVASVVGAVIHGATAWIQTSGGAGLDPLAATLESPLLVGLWAVAAILVLVASIAFARATLRTPLRAVAWLNPALVTVALGALGQASPLLQAFLAPAAPNLAHLVFFSTVALAPGRRTPAVP